MKILCVAEKPSISKAIAEALCGGRCHRRATKNKFIYNYDFTYNFSSWGPCDVTVTAVSGHLTKLEFQAPFSDWGHPPISLFEAPTFRSVEKSNHAIAENIRRESRNVDCLYIWTDCDLEGEHIAQEIIDEARKTNTRATIKRAQFNNVDHDHLRQAANNPRELDKRLVEAVNARQELDLRTGFAMTRLTTKVYSSKIPSFQKTRRVISYGSCQFPTLGFVVDRYWRVKRHISENFWYVALKLEKDKQLAEFKWERHRLFDHMSATVLYERALLKGGTEAKIVEAQRKPTKQYKPLPLTTVKLQKLGATYLKMTSQTIMHNAERLYNKGFISYPRTETDRFDKAIDVRGLVSRQKDQPDWGSYARKLIDEGGYQPPRQGTHDDKAHPPIHPIKAATTQVLNSTEFKIYEFICRHFLACCSEDAKGVETKVKAQYGDEYFHANGVVVQELNYLEIYKYASWKSTHLPNFENGETVNVKSAKLESGTTSPPGFLTEPELISLMDSNGIGTDATMADHIQKIVDREFVVRTGNHFVPTNLGISLVEGYDSIGLEKSLTKPALRRETEKIMHDICSGTKTRNQCMTLLISQYTEMFRLTDRNKDKLEAAARKHLVDAAA